MRLLLLAVRGPHWRLPVSPSNLPTLAGPKGTGYNRDALRSHEDTALCELLDIDVPIIQAPMGGASCPAMAVSAQPEAPGL